ncbi:MAG: class I SAM-dependent methyltransferase [Deltaproteobacteria bacterium]|nr:class I SAM-dependent methyltransferase [Deltaproteobacteria bacterium]
MKFNNAVSSILFDRVLKPPWFPLGKPIFDGDDYHESYRYDDFFAPKSFWIKTIEKVCATRGGPCLDIGGGTGFTAEALVRAGLTVTTIEKSSVMIGKAWERWKKLNSDEQARWNLIHGDLRDIRLKHKFSTLLALGGPMTFLNNEYELLSCLENYRNLLDRTGVFYLDVFNIDYWAGRPHWKQGVWNLWFTKRVGGRFFCAWHKTSSGEHQSQIKFEYQLAENFLTYRRTGTHVLFMPLAAWKRLLEKAGYSIVKTFGNWLSEVEGAEYPPTPHNDLITFKLQPLVVRRFS